MNKTPTCKHCGKPIKFINIDGRWIPYEPGGEDRHRCELEQTCEECGKTFQGAPWMKKCKSCFRSQSEQDYLDRNRVFRGKEKPPGRETLKEGLDDEPLPF